MRTDEHTTLLACLGDIQAAVDATALDVEQLLDASGIKVEDPAENSGEPPAWANEAGYRYRSRRAFEAAEKEIHEEKRVPELVYAVERLATKEEVERVRRGGPRRPVGVKGLRAVEPSRRREPSNRLQGLGPAVVATAVLIAWAVVAFVVFWFLTALLGF